MLERKVLTLATVLGIAAGSLAAAGQASAASAGLSGSVTSGKASGWVGSWEAAMARDATSTMANKSIRNVVHISLGGSAVRIRLSNTFGTASASFSHVTVAVQRDGANSPAAVPGTMRELSFAGKRSVVAAAGTDVLSDPVRLTVPDQANLLVSVYTPADPGPVTYHSLAEQTSFVSVGADQASEVSGQSYTGEIYSWYYLTGVDVYNPAARGSVVAFGDSITDGYMSTFGANLRWPDQLADRMEALPINRRLGVQNAGISGNRLLLYGMYDSFGPSALDRELSDVLNRTGASTMILMLGINDIQQEPYQTDPAKINAALETIAERAAARGIKVVGATLLPFEGWKTFSPEMEPVRLAVNDFIRTSSVFKSVVDFDLVLRDPEHQSQMLAAYDCGDHLHPNDAGYKLMADSVNLRTLA